MPLRGIIMSIMGLLQLSFLVRFLSRPALSGPSACNFLRWRFVEQNVDVQYPRCVHHSMFATAVPSTNCFPCWMPWPRAEGPSAIVWPDIGLPRLRLHHSERFADHSFSGQDHGRNTRLSEPHWAGSKLRLFDVQSLPQDVIQRRSQIGEVPKFQSQNGRWPQCWACPAGPAKAASWMSWSGEPQVSAWQLSALPPENWSWLPSPYLLLLSFCRDTVMGPNIAPRSAHHSQFLGCIIR